MGIIKRASNTHLRQLLMLLGTALCCARAPAQGVGEITLEPGELGADIPSRQTLSQPPPARRGWQFTPRLNAEFLYSDNLRRKVDSEADSGFVAALAPGFELRRGGGRLELELDYELVNLLFDDGEADARHRVDAEATLELARDLFFVDAEASFRQIQFDVISDLGADLISNPDDFSDVAAFSISPYLASRLSGYADFIARYTHRQVIYERNSPDAVADGVSLELDSRPSAGRFEWQARYTHERRRFDDQQDVDTQFGSRRFDDERREDFFAEGVYFVTRQWGLGARAGYENNDLGGNFEDGENGSFWSLGAVWRPHRDFEAAAFVGPDDNEFNLRYSPSRRTDLEISRRDRSVGLNDGEAWDASLDHRTRYSRWSAVYTDQVVGGALLELEDSPLFTDGGADGQQEPGLAGDFSAIGDDFDGISGGFDGLLGGRGGLNLPLTGENFRRRRFEAGAVYDRARTRVASRGYFETRDFADQGGDGDLRGVGARLELSRLIGPRTLSAVSADWAKVESDDGGRERELWTFQTLIAHQLARDFDVGLSYAYTESEADNAGDEFEENRLGALMRLQF